MPTTIALASERSARTDRAERYRLDHVSDDALHTGLKTLTGRHNTLTAELLAHLAEVETRGIYRERACSSLYTYCVYELRLSEDEAQRRARAARTARAFPVLFEMLADGAIHLTGLLLLAPHLTLENHAELLARARFRTKREIEHLVAEIAPRPDVPARIEPLGPRPTRVANLWQAFAASLRGPVRELAPGLGAAQAPPAMLDDEGTTEPSVTTDQSELVGSSAAAAGVEECELEREPGITESSAPARVDVSSSAIAARSLAPIRYRVEFTASQRYVELLEEARNLLQHQVPDRDVARVHELALEAFVGHLRKRRQAATGRSRRAAHSAPRGTKTASDGSAPARARDAAFEGSAPERVWDAESDGSAPARVSDAEREGSAPTRVPDAEFEGPAPERMKANRKRPAGGNDRRNEVHGARHVPADVRRAVWQRDGGRCAFLDPNGRRCAERAGLELHHEHAFALGGPTTFENLRLLCRAHNALFAERDFGRDEIRRQVERARSERHRGPAG